MSQLITPCCQKPMVPLDGHNAGRPCVMFNPDTELVQCHRCGATWAPAPGHEMGPEEVAMEEEESVLAKLSDPIPVARSFVDRVPMQPGVYVLLDQRGVALEIDEASTLRDRFRLFLCWTPLLDPTEGERTFRYLPMPTAKVRATRLAVLRRHYGTKR